MSQNQLKKEKSKPKQNTSLLKTTVHPGVPEQKDRVHLALAELMQRLP